MMDFPDEQYDLATPRPDSLIESLRAVGYDLPTAIADLVDNSISAGSKNVWLDFQWNGADSHLAIIDDGSGMDAETLLNAMRIGSRNPLEERSTGDLGRFGLGLKTATFSQARRLTVASKTDTSKLDVRRWDLDYIARTGEWRLLKLDGKHLGLYDNLLTDSKSGTIVLWENLDRVVGGFDVNNSVHHTHFLDAIETVEKHLSMVFHRYLEGPQSLNVLVNGSSLKAWDPFCTREPATQCLTDEALSIFGKRLSVRPYVLPHHSKLGPDKLEAAAGPKGWLDQQGFYVYRNKRLLVGGDWLGLGFQKEDHYKLARIAIDIPNSMDAEWHIDIKKSRATPPATLRRDLHRIGQLARKSASDIYRHRGTRLTVGATQMTMLWEKTVQHGVIGYKINRGYPLVEQLLNNSGDARKNVRALLTLIEETVPVPTIIIDGAENPDKQAQPFEHRLNALKELIQLTYQGFRRSGVSRTDAITRIMNLEPFSQFPEIVLSMPDDQDIS